MRQRPRGDLTEDAAKDSGDRDAPPARPNGMPRSAAEWTTFGISAIVLLAVVGLVTALHVSGGEHPPIIAVETRLDEIRRDAEAYYLPVDVRNRGDRTAEAVTVQAELDTGSGAPLTAEVTIAFLAGGEVARGTFVFSADPAQGALTVQPVSYQEP